MLPHQELLPDQLPAEPLEQAAEWLAEAVRAKLQPNPNSMVLATADASGAPSARVVLCKEIRPHPGYIMFFTNYLSRKGVELSVNPRAAAVIHWDAMRRQVRLEGRVIRATAAQSDTYFASRAWQSRVGAWASQQSAPLASRAALQQATEQAAQRFGAPSPIANDPAASVPDVAIPRPPYWGGYQLWVDAVELWVEGSARLHERARWSRTLEPDAGGFRGGPWTATRLQP